MIERSESMSGAANYGDSMVRNNKDRCDDCGGPIYCGDGPTDGWQLDDGRNVCNECSVADLKRIAELVKQNPPNSKPH